MSCGQLGYTVAKSVADDAWLPEAWHVRCLQDVSVALVVHAASRLSEPEFAGSPQRGRVQVLRRQLALLLPFSDTCSMPSRPVASVKYMPMCWLNRGSSLVDG